MGKAWSDGELLLAAIQSGQMEIVTALREAGCPILCRHLHALANFYNPSLLDTLNIEPEYASTLVNLELLTELVGQKSWSYLIRLVSAFF
ncbi:hypothetical protein OESDEN_22986 [Oesophagostomum dentatum]|uniref:Ankyrin repeat protein n=1 Tax=Oesophagostomum dentatum TaxID=61180 RepID=A0A0B1RXI2_OESDE|nr:hypothetical protein OESDEN_22986 [Oesophagostomum dentatum]